MFVTHVEGRKKFVENSNAPLPWDAVIDDDNAKIALIDANDVEVAFILMVPSRDRAVRLARLIVEAVNERGGYISPRGPVA